MQLKLSGKVWLELTKSQKSSVLFAYALRLFNGLGRIADALAGLAERLDLAFCLSVCGMLLLSIIEIEHFSMIFPSKLPGIEV